MRLEGKVWKDKKSSYWIITVPFLALTTQGKSKKDAYFMIKDAIELAIHKPGFRIEVITGRGAFFSVRANNTKHLVAFMLKQLRAIRGLTIKNVTARLGMRSLNAYAQFEQGRCVPTLDKVDELIRAIDPNLEPIWKFG